MEAETTFNRITPKSERELAEASGGDVVIITDNYSEIGRPSTYVGSEEGRDLFIYQFKAGVEHVTRANSRRNTIQFDEQRGAILSHLHTGYEIIQPGEDNYDEYVTLLQGRNLWESD